MHQDLAWALTHGTGTERMFLCPVHGDNNPSASVNVLKGVWVCYSCGAKGTLDSVITDPNLQMDALDELVKSMAIDLEPVFYTESWLNQFDSGPVHAYWISRFGYAAVRHFRLGYDPGRHAVTYPLRTPGGRILGVVRRRLENDGGPKYVYPTGTNVSELLFNYSADAREVVYLVEGALDAVACWEAGVEAFAIYGARISEQQLALLDRTGAVDVVCVFDQDEAGESAYAQVKEMAKDKFVHRMSWDRDLGKDIAEMDLPTRLDQFEKVRQDLLGLPTCDSASSPTTTLRLRAGRTPSATTSTPGHLKIVPTKPA